MIIRFPGAGHGVIYVPFGRAFREAKIHIRVCSTCFLIVASSQEKENVEKATAAPKARAAPKKKEVNDR